MRRNDTSHEKALIRKGIWDFSKIRGRLQGRPIGITSQARWGFLKSCLIQVAEALFFVKR